MKAKLVILASCALVMGGPLQVSAAPAQTGAAQPYKAPRNAFGQPDLDGVWSNTTMTRMERQPQYGDRLVLSPAEVTALEGGRAKQLADGNKPTAPGATVEDVNKTCDLPGFPANTDCAYNSGWTDAGERVMRVNGQPRSSFITFPANGRIPHRADAKRNPGMMGEGVADNPEDRALPERCLVSQNISTGALLQPSLYNNTNLFQQGPDSLAIVVEMSHDVRLIRFNAKHGAAPRWFGDSVGHWEGDTLVVDTVNFDPHQLLYNSSQLHIVERFTRVAKDRLLYQFRVEDPGVYNEPWGGEYEFHTSPGPQYEYACHEGNYGLMGILQGARAKEKDAAGGQATASNTAGR